jgi:hypothetical protein
MRLLQRAFADRIVESITTADLERIMEGWGSSKKSWNNLRTYLHAFFAFCARPSPRWLTANPAKAIKQHDIVRGLPRPPLKQSTTPTHESRRARMCLSQSERR